MFPIYKLQMTTSHGVNQCTYCLVTSGHQCAGVQFPTVAAAKEACGICYFGEKESRCVGQAVPSNPVMSGAAATSSRSPLLGFSP